MTSWRISIAPCTKGILFSAICAIAAPGRALAFEEVDCRALTVSAYAASGADCVRIGGRPSSLETASSQTWASCRKDTRTSLAFASRAHWKHSSAIARYSAAVFIGRNASFPTKSFAGFPKFVCLRSDSTKDLLMGLASLRQATQKQFIHTLSLEGMAQIKRPARAYCSDFRPRYSAAGERRFNCAPRACAVSLLMGT